MIVSQARIDKILSAAIDHIALSQDADGSFPSLSSSNLNFSNSTTYHTTFFTSLIMACLSVENAGAAEPIKRKGVNFLLAQKSSQWSYNYWNRGSAEFTTRPYPDDLDDTFCALGALASSDSSLITGQVLAAAVSMLTALEVQPGGPYRTWLVEQNAPPIWKDVDFAVNCNIAWFLSKQNVKLPGLTDFITDHIRQGDYSSPYYFSSYPLVYFASRAYPDLVKEEVSLFLKKQKIKEDGWGTTLAMALVIISSLRCRTKPQELDEVIPYLIYEYEQDYWQPYGFCIDPSQNNQKHVAGSTSLTAAMCYEALTLYKQSLREHSSHKVTADNEVERAHEAVIIIVRERFSALPGKLQQDALAELEITIKRDQDRQITLLPFFFARSLNAPIKLRPAFLAQLGAANLYGWIAYTIYDNVIDDNRQVELLPLANVCLREVIDFYNNQMKGDFVPVFQQIMVALESANHWELGKARTPLTRGNLTIPQFLPDYGDYSVLAEKSLGHILGPLATLSQLGYSADSTEMTAATQMFKHYLIARQLNDDAHDWQDDLKKGQLNSVAVMALAQWQAGQKEKRNLTLNLAGALPQLQELFWDKTIHHVAELIHRHTAQARKCRRQLTIMADDSFLERLLMPLEQAATTAQKESARAKDFLAAYKGS